MAPPRLLRYGTLAFLGGVAIASFVQFSPYALGIGAVFVFGTIAILVPHGMPASSARKAGLITACFLLFFILGAWRMTRVLTHSHILDTYLSGQIVASLKKTELVGIVADDPAVDDAKQQITLTVRNAVIVGDTIGDTITVDENILLTLAEIPRYHYGDYLRVTGTLRLPFVSRDSTFDYGAYLARRGIFTTMINPTVEVLPSQDGFMQRMWVGAFLGIYAIRNTFLASINRALPEPHAAFIAGILAGTRSQLPDSIKQDFARTSTSHIVAVSGYNITIVATAIATLLLYFMRRSYAFWYTVAGLVAFMILTGAQASVMRATIMGIAVLLARNAGRLTVPAHTLTLTAGIMTALNPHILLSDIGFQLSFFSTAGILFVSPLLEKRLPFIAKRGIIGETLIMTLSAQLCVLPILAYYFKSVSLVSLPVNIIVLPFIPAAMLLGFLTGIAGLILPALGQVIGYGTWIVSAGILGIIRLFSRIPWASVSVEFTLPFVLLTYGVMIVLYWWFVKSINGKAIRDNSI